jgi:hypothetical protein
MILKRPSLVANAHFYSSLHWNCSQSISNEKFCRHIRASVEKPSYIMQEQGFSDLRHMAVSAIDVTCHWYYSLRDVLNREQVIPEKESGVVVKVWELSLGSAAHTYTILINSGKL